MTVRFGMVVFCHIIGLFGLVRLDLRKVGLRVVWSYRSCSSIYFSLLNSIEGDCCLVLLFLKSFLLLTFYSQRLFFFSLTHSRYFTYFCFSSLTLIYLYLILFLLPLPASSHTSNKDRNTEWTQDTGNPALVTHALSIRGYLCTYIFPPLYVPLPPIFLSGPLPLSLPPFPGSNVFYY